MWCAAWNLALVLSLGVAESTWDEVNLMQQRESRMQFKYKFNHTSDEALQDLASRLLHAKAQCLQSSMDCLPTLKQVRYRVWPFVQNLLGEQFQGFDPMDFHPQVAKAAMHCADKDYTMVYLHMWKAAGYSLMENLRAIGGSYEVVDSFEDDFNWCENLRLDPSQRQRGWSSFTFVREPLGRFISGYAEIDRTYQGPRYEFFHKAEEGSLERAQLFMERFFQDGLIFNGHVKPQSEYFAPFAPSCRLPIDFVGKIENLEEDWKKLLENKQCEAASRPFNHSLGQHPTDERERQAMNDFLESKNLANFVVRNNKNNKSSMSSKHLRNVLHQEGFAFLRAFCWISLPDYVMFDYELPSQCNDPEMQQVIELTRRS